ncbi:MAG: 3-dehydroquinate synthase, partial [Phycisphaeraceae bacterium]|nr:3-dehydroquinate synthase [Phycisphaeraceae bacterium]
ERDPREAGDRALLNLGHTYAHALESRTELGLVHGEAVAIGLVAACRAAVAAGLQSDAAMEDRIRAVLLAAGLPTGVSGLSVGDLDELTATMRVDKKANAGRIRLVLPRRIGDVVVVDDPGDAVVRAGWDAVIDAG